MVAVTVGLIALASTIVFDLGSGFSEPADVSGQISFDEESGEIPAEVIMNENAQSASIRWEATGSGTSPDTAMVSVAVLIIQELEY